ncbi:F0F1 ATP synthase subunit epsilon [soil metagenome]
MAVTTGKTLKLIVVTPEKAVLDQVAEMVVVPLFDGEAGIQAGHSPFVGQLGPGELRYKVGGNTHRLFIDGGFVQVRTDTVNILTPFARKPEELTDALLNAEKTKAEALPGSNPIETATKQRAAAKIKGMAKVKAKF